MSFRRASQIGNARIQETIFGENVMVVRCALIFTISCVGLDSAFAESVPPLPITNHEMVEGFIGSRYTAQTNWKTMSGSKPVSVVDIGGKKALRMPCNFRGTKIDRASWDRRVKLDLTMCKGLQFLFYCRDASPISSFSVYFHSGQGWYAGRFDAGTSSGWNTVKVHKSATNIEGRPAGWGKVDTVRISAWRGRDVDTEFYIASPALFGTDGKVVVIRGDSALSKTSGEAKIIRQYTDIMRDFLDRSALSYIVLSDVDVTAERLKGRELVILPYNPKMPDNAVNEIAKFLRAGGRLIACYILPKRLEPLVGIKVGAHIRQKYKGYFASIRSSQNGLRGMPAVTKQASWNIHDASVVKGQGRVVAWWHSSNGQSTGKPAIVASKNCIFLTHVLLSDDSAHKMQMLLAMMGNLSPALWREAAEQCIDRVGRFAGYADYDSASQGITKLAAGDVRVLPVLNRGGEVRRQALALLSRGDFSETISAAEKARASMIEAYYLAQKPLPGEHRAFWSHSAFGVAGKTWDRAIKLLADNGFTAILPNMLWGGVAYYKSDVLPVSATVAEKGDQIALCLAACKKYGIKCHIWKVNYNMGWAADKKFMGKMKAQGRTQVSYDGSSNDRWLCPSHPDNQKLEIESMLEVARKYDVDGLHFDYIRYPGRNGCFCKGCRLRFERAIGRRVNNWPGDVRKDDSLNEKWLDFRRRQITAVVAAVANRANQVRPGVKISAAVFRNWTIDRDSVGQDWKSWCDLGYLDFVCPMDYTASSSHFQRMAEQQLTWAGKVPCYPGIGLSVWSDSTDICKLIEQINITRQLDTGGFTIFNYGPTEANEVLPLLGKGITRKK